MVHSSRSGTATYASRKNGEDLVKAKRDRTKFSDYEIAFLGLVSSEGHEDQIDEGMKVDTQPIDFETKEKKDKIDIRKDPKKGGNEYP